MVKKQLDLFGNVAENDQSKEEKLREVPPFDCHTFVLLRVAG